MIPYLVLKGGILAQKYGTKLVFGWVLIKNNATQKNIRKLILQSKINVDFSDSQISSAA